ncbi:hypothetical protein RJZ56_006742 [Blastomyces dermatitidis]|uniref:Cyclin-dependent protein kinase complex component n=2 Tax=Ajellomyces dermatitidis TaxID=5039 RepID=F2TSQ0_AJEDA|nr:cyclin-dependent protein kinase complex component [Blastomyces dermatitidis ER-3]EEQ91929.1 cyclin-dependent protein kinase complex component [Blastomyces dermatitidis ER-3]EGE86263.1 cyclin-dependent protein kinase complex component [Blastomyces dermatitidis ATCC 18188]
MLSASVGQSVSVTVTVPAPEPSCRHPQSTPPQNRNQNQHRHPRPHPHPHPANPSNTGGSTTLSSTTSIASTSQSPTPSSSSFSPPSSTVAPPAPPTNPIPHPISFSSSSRSSHSADATVNPAPVHSLQNAPSPPQPPGPPISAASMTSLPNPHRFPDRHRSAYRQHSPQHNQGFDHAGIPLSNTRSGFDSDNPSSHSSPRLQPTYRSSLSLGGSEATSPSRIQVHDLSHIRSFANEEVLASSRRLQTQGSNGRSQQDVGRQYEISSMPITDIIEMVAGLLTKITTTNDQQHEHIHRNIPPTDGAGGISAQTTSVLAFHGKNVPSITILSYLSRIHKYCPTTYEVFLSLLVYFDRMTEMVNKAFIQSLQQRSDQHSSSLAPHSSPSTSIPSGATPNRPSTRGSIATPPSSVQMRARDNDPSSPSPPSTIYQEFIPPSSSTTPAAYEDAYSLSHYFVVDSFNIHRLVIAGVTCASKFFSDVFYTNSRYAKVGGLPLLELNHLELQFLLLNDFRLAIPVEELEAYGTMLVEFYAREVVAQQQQQLPQQPQNPGDGQDHPFSTTGHRAKDGAYMEQRPSQREGIIQANVSQTPTPP